MTSPVMFARSGEVMGGKQVEHYLKLKLLYVFLNIRRDTINVTILFILSISLIYQMHIFAFIEENFYF